MAMKKMHKKNRLESLPKAGFTELSSAGTTFIFKANILFASGDKFEFFQSQFDLEAVGGNIHGHPAVILIIEIRR